MKDRWKRLVAVEAVLAGLSAVLVVLTLVWRDWIETVFRVHPDAGGGEAEWLVVGALLAVSLGLSLHARLTWRRHVAAPT